jgi:putative membrane protein
MRLLLVWLLNTLALIAVAYLLPNVSVATFATALVGALVLGLVNSVIRPVLVLLTLPVTVLTLGLFILVINGLMFWFAAAFVPGFDVAGFWAGVLGALVYSVISWFLSALVLQ